MAKKPETVSDLDLVRSALRDIVGDINCPPAARAAAARTLAEIVGALGRHAPDPAEATRTLGELSRADLERELAAIRSVGKA